MPTIEERAAEARRLLEVHGTYLAGIIATLEALDAERAAHAQFRQEVSDEIERCILSDFTKERLSRFILPKPVDPLVEAVKDCGYATLDAIEPEFAAELRAALAKRGLKLVDVGDGL